MLNTKLKKRDLYLNRMIAFQDKEMIKVVTGSNACLLSSELSTYLSGRYVEIKVLPFSFREFLDFHGYVVTEMKYVKIMLCYKGGCRR